MNNTEKLMSLLSRVLKTDEDIITDDTTPDDLETWDSFNTLAMIMEIEKEFEVALPLEEVINIKSVKDIKILLKTKGIDIDV